MLIVIQTGYTEEIKRQKGLQDNQKSYKQSEFNDEE